VNWNVHVGHGNVAHLVEELSRAEQAKGYDRPEFVLLLQETFRRGSEVPVPGNVSVPRRISPPISAMDIEDLARELGWWMYYVPSMRNGNRVGADAEDRGNAILSSLPLADLEAVELPFVVQRRVALIATVTDAQSKPKLRVAVAHLDTRAPFFKGWILGGPSARNRQAHGIVAALGKFQNDNLPLVLGSDLNSVFGTGESAVATVSKAVARIDCGKQGTHIRFRTDHVIARTREVRTPDCARIARRSTIIQIGNSSHSSDVTGNSLSALIVRVFQTWRREASGL
jgi:endonuclease/exonuclease/phosphatase family metal-dependent hydrolase